MSYPGVKKSSRRRPLAMSATSVRAPPAAPSLLPRAYAFD